MTDVVHASELSTCCGSSQRVLYAAIRYDGDGWSKIDLECCSCGGRVTLLCSAGDALRLMGANE